ncbi:tRNA (N6-isopentenyl adenosine(37)-C2)-methylthiotransferase MiaB [Desulfovibrio sp. OttesenSCG-928-A18]|nr:tRNA (N6-isopentenyl adenosine(37)-C2)-methylthiotransferase MiaB [Desulfovibrio sp. OttesenSCG-928-A18]
MAPVFHIQSFGCQMNASDSDWLARALILRGFRQGGFEEADVYILNTCSVRDKPEQKVYSELGRIARYNKVHGRSGITVCVGGCVAQQVGAAIVRRFPEVRLVFGTDGIASAPSALCRLLEEPGLRLSLPDFSESYIEREQVWTTVAVAKGQPGAQDPEQPDMVPPAAYVNIMQGCNNYCTYCIVPFVRGAQKSRSPEAVLEECRTLLACGARDITLLGQNVNAYGQDAGGRGIGFTQLLYKVAALPGLERLRFVTSHPKDIAPELIRAFGELEALCPRLHLPVQSGSDRILAAMNRRYDCRRYLDIVHDLRQARPDIVLTTDIIVGFPGEREEDFQETMKLMRDVGFAASFSFVYSDRPGAKAVLLPDKVDRAVALERLSRLQDWQNSASDRVLALMKGVDGVILLEGKSRLDQLLVEPDADTADPLLRHTAQDCGTNVLESWQGRTAEGFIVNVTLPSRQGRDFRSGGWQGAMLPVRIEAAARHSLKGRQAGAPW